MKPNEQIDFRSEPDGQGTRVIVFVSESVAEHRRIEQMLSGSIWNVDSQFTCKHAIERLSRERTPVVVCERELPDGYWTDVFAGTSALNPRPEMIVTAKKADERLWAEVLNLGGYDVLEQPFDTREVVASVSAAWRHWHNRQHKIRKLPASAGWP